MHWPRRLGMFLLAGTLIALGPQGVYGPNGTVVVLALLLLGAALCRPSAADLGQALARFCSGNAVLAVGLGLAGAWILAGSLWAPVFTGEKALRAVALLAGGCATLLLWRATRDVRPPWLVKAALVGGGSMLALFALETASDGWLIWRLDPPGLDSPSLRAGRPSQNPVQQGTAVLAVLIWPLLLCLRRVTRRRWPAMVALVVAGVVVALLPMAASAAALILGLLVYGAVRLVGRRAVDGLFVLLALGALSGPLLPAGLLGLQQASALELPFSWQDRLEIWARSAQLIAEQPLVGHGFHASRWLGRPESAAAAAGALEPAVAPLPLHPHNAVLQIWLELGLVGVLIALLIVYGLWRALARLPDRPEQAHAAACFAALLVFALVSFGLWQSWLQALVWLAVVLLDFGRAGAATAAASRAAS